MPLWGTYPLPLWLPFQLTFASWRDSPKRNKPNTKPEISQKALSKCIAISLWQTITVKVTVNATVIAGPGAAARKFHMKMWPGNMKMRKCVRPKSTKQTRNLAPPTSVRVPVCVCECVSAIVCDWQQQHCSHTYVSCVVATHQRERERERTSERAKSARTQLALTKRAKGNAKERRGERKRQTEREKERKLLESKFTRWYMKAYQAQLTESRLDICIQSSVFPQGEACLEEGQR